MGSKGFFIRKIIEEWGSGNCRMLDLGCGTARYMPAILEEFQNIEYTGLEPSESSYQKAIQNVGSHQRAQFFNQLGYDTIEGIKAGSFDVVFSLSVLEHVKQLGRFIDMSAKYLAPGGLLVHRYDLGHALTPNSLKERFHVFLGNTFPAVLPETKFVRYVPLSEVQEHTAKALGREPYKVTYHQMPDHKQFEKVALGDELALAKQELYGWELKYSPLFDSIPLEVRERLFPAIAVWARKDR